MSGENQVTMKLESKNIWLSFSNMFLGLWLLTSPVTFGYKDIYASYSDWISGFILIIAGLISIRRSSFLVVACIIGFWLQLAPLIFWVNQSVIYLNDTLIGLLIILFCVLTTGRKKEFDIGPKIPFGWSYNPSSWSQRVPIAFLTIVCWFLARYMTSFQLGYIGHVWDPFFGGGTERVISSDLSRSFPISDAGLGALAYSLEAIMCIKGGVRRWHTMPWIVISFGFLVIPVGLVSTILIMLQPIAVGAWCGICLITAICMLIMLTLTVGEVFAVFQYLFSGSQDKRSLLHRLFYGSNFTKYEDDSFHKDIKYKIRGVGLPINLIGAALLGVWLLFFNNLLGLTGHLANGSNICAALIIVFSIVSCAEVVRVLRFANVIIATGFSVIVLLYSESPLVVVHGGILSALVTLLSFFRGSIKEEYGSWKKLN